MALDQVQLQRFRDLGKGVRAITTEDTLTMTTEAIKMQHAHNREFFMQSLVWVPILVSEVARLQTALDAATTAVTRLQAELDKASHVADGTLVEVGDGA